MTLFPRCPAQTFPPLSAAELADGEKRLRKQLPDAYRALLLQSNGAVLESGVFFRAPANGDPGVLLDVRTLSGILPKDSAVTTRDLVGWNRFVNGALGLSQPKGSFSFAHSKAGSFVFFASGPKAGCVAHQERISKKVQIVARSMDEFLAGLRARTAADVVAAFPIAPTEYASTRPATATPAKKPRRTSSAKLRVYEGVKLPEEPNAWIPEGHVVRDVRAVDCTFGTYRQRGGGYAQFEHIELVRPKRTTRLIMNVALRDVTIEAADPAFGDKRGAVLRDLHERKLLSLVNVLCDRVTLIGEFGDLLLRNDTEKLSPEQRRFAASFYDDVEWALDIRRARFRELTLRSLPGHLVRRDPARHALILTERLAADRSWERWTEARTALAFALEHPDECHFLIAADSPPSTAAADRKRIAELRAAGLVD